MSQEIHKIRRAIIIPLTIAVFSLALLLLLSLFFPSLPGERFVLAVIFFIGSYFLLEVFAHSVSFKAESVEIKKFLRKKEISWNDITQVGSVIMGRKVYLLLTTTKGFYILSNNYDKFSKLLERIKERLDEERVEGDVLRLIEHPLQNNKPIFMAWLMTMILVTIITLRLYLIFFVTGK